MDLLEIRDAIVALIEPAFKQAYPGVALVFNNGPFDWNAPPAISLHVEIEMNGGHRIRLGGERKSRVYGIVYATSRQADSAGHRAGLGMLNWAAQTLGEAGLSTPGYRLVMKDAEPSGVHPMPGLYGEAIKVEFCADPT